MRFGCYACGDLCRDECGDSRGREGREDDEYEGRGQEDSGSGGSSGHRSLSLALLKTLRSLTPTVMEGLLSHLSGGTLLVAGLSYGLGVRINALRHVRLRDVHSGGRSLDIAGRRYTVPTILVDDLRDFIQERVCGFEASVSVYRREQALFGSEVFELLNGHVATCISRGGWDWLHPECAAMFSGVVSERFVALCIAFLSRAHSKRITAAEVPIKKAGGKKPPMPPAPKLTPLDLLEKGPRIVRRARSGAITAYYLWRVSADLPAIGSSSSKLYLENR